MCSSVSKIFDNMALTYAYIFINWMHVVFYWYTKYIK